MVDPVPPASRAAAARAVGQGRALVVIGPRSEPSGNQGGDPGGRRSADGHKPAQVSAVGAQLLGEKPRRGLRAGQEVLEQARSTYLQNEYSGARDRRPRKGQLTKTEI